jgi:hypothetical protein
MSKSKPRSKAPRVVYASSERPAIEYADFVRLSTGPNGIVFGFGQNHPTRKEVSLTYEVLVPYDVAARFHNILTEQLQGYEKHLKESLEALKKDMP